MNDELAVKLGNFGGTHNTSRITNFGEYSRELDSIISPYGFSARWSTAPLGVILTHLDSGRNLRMRIADIQKNDKLPLWSIRKLENMAKYSGTTAMLRNVGGYLLAVSDKEDAFSFEAYLGEDIEVPEELLEHEAFQQAFKQGLLERLDSVPAGKVRLDLDRTEARHALRSLRRTMEMVLNLTATEGESEENRQWRYVSYGMMDARRLTDALETAIGPEQTVGCPECTRPGDTQCGLCGGSGEVPETIFD